MKKIAILLTLMIMSLIGAAQSIKDTIYPQALLSDNGEVLGIVFTIEQAQKIDNDYELFSLMDSIIKQHGLTDSITIGVIDAQNKKITQLELQIENYEELLMSSKDMLSNRNSVIDELNSKVKIMQEQIELYKEIDVSHTNEKKLLMKEIRKHKAQKIIGFITTGLLAVGVVIVSVI